jgi:hypothetical protein
MADQRHSGGEGALARVPRLEITCSPAARVCRTLGAPSRVTIGSSSVADFRIVSRGVRARHVVIDWDGRALVIVEKNGPVLVNGRSVEPPFAIVGEAHLLVGDATIWLAVPAIVDEPPTLLSANEAPTLPNMPTHSEAPVATPPRSAPRMLLEKMVARVCATLAFAAAPSRAWRIGLVAVAALVVGVALRRFLIHHPKP